LTPFQIFCLSHCFMTVTDLVDITYPKEYTILKHGLFVNNFGELHLCQWKDNFGITLAQLCLSCFIQAWLKAKVTCNRRQSEWTLVLIVLSSMMNEICSSYIYDEWVMSCVKLLKFVMCLASSPIWIHLVTYPNWIKSFLQGLVQQNIQCLHK
jgi:hypothetical protein